MLLIVPSSETKRPPPRSGPPVDIEDLSFPELMPTRRRLVDALIATSADLDAFARLGVRHTMADEVARNTHLYDVPAIPVLDLYTGPLHEGLDAAGLSEGARERADRCLVVISALWGALRPADRIPPYRMILYADLVGVGRPDWVWRELLPGVLADAAAAAPGVIADFRSRPSQSTGRPAGLSDRTVTLRVDQGPAGHRLGDVIAKRVRGEAARFVLESGADAADPPELAAILGDRGPVGLEEPSRPGLPWTLTLSID
jgi:cytoplasmic iron level regulating protein YaaA (DUF328/UPF0246 family)